MLVQRRGEVHKLEWTDIKKDYVIFRNRKNYHQLKVLIAPKLKAILEEYPVFKKKGKVIGLYPDTISRIIKGYLRKAGLGDLRSHDLRHTFASHLVMSGVDLVTVKELLGHSSIDTTMIYAHLTDKHLKGAINKLPY